MSITPRNIYVYVCVVRNLCYDVVRMDYVWQLSYVLSNLHHMDVSWCHVSAKMKEDYKHPSNLQKERPFNRNRKIEVSFQKLCKTISYRCVSAVSNLLRVNSVIPAGIWPWVCSINHPVCQLPSPWKWWIIDSHPVCKLSVAFSMEVTDHGFSFLILADQIISLVWVGQLTYLIGVSLARITLTWFLRSLSTSLIWTCLNDPR